MMRALLLCLLVAGCQNAHAVQTGGSGINFENYPSYLVWQRLDPAVGDHPGDTPAKTQMDPVLAWCFDADGEHQHFITPIPADWDGATDIQIGVGWTNETADALTDGETVIWKVVWYCINPAIVQTFDNGTPVTVTSTYSQSGAGTDKDVHATFVIVDHDHGDQTITSDWFFHFVLSRDMTSDTYAGDACMIGLKWGRYVNKLVDLH